MVEEGKPAPDFTLRSDAGEDVSLANLRGRTVVLYFYPRDDTPGCTTQACGLRDVYGEIQERGATVLGVSPDTEASHVKFRDKYGLPFPLLADPDHEVAERYGVWVEKNMYGKKSNGHQALDLRDRRRGQRGEGDAGRQARRPRRQGPRGAALEPS